jgi:serine/threonine protein kinase
VELPQLTKYELLAKIGEGGTGTVYKARHRVSGELVAVKIIPETLDCDRLILKRLEQEFLTVSRLGHPGIVRGLDFGQEGSSHYLVMELLDPISLGERIERHGPLPEAVAVSIISEVAHALQAAHEHGLIHRDVKPKNVMLTREGEVKLSDFGTVKEMTSDLVLTRLTDLLGTPAFMAPEQFDGAQHASVRSDIYSLAATLYTAVTGKVPFPGKTSLAILTRKIRHPLPSPRQVMPSLSERTERAILRSLNPDPEARPASCLAFLADLESTVGRPKSDPSVETLTGSSLSGQLLPKVERRGQPRRRVRGTARYRPGASPYGPFAKAILVDASLSGVQILVQEQFKVGEGVEVELLTPEGMPVLRREALVRWAVAAPQSLYCRLGCRWKQPLTHAELQSFA